MAGEEKNTLEDNDDDSPPRLPVKLSFHTIVYYILSQVYRWLNICFRTRCDDDDWLDRRKTPALQ